jgi:hypothetical protein
MQKCVNKTEEGRNLPMGGSVEAVLTVDITVRVCSSSDYERALNDKNQPPSQVTALLSSLVSTFARAELA